LRIKEQGTHLTLNEHDDDDDDKTIHVSSILSSHHQQFSTVHSALVSFMQVFDDRLQAESGWNCECSSTLNLLGSGHQKPA